MNNIKNIEKPLIKCIELSILEMNKYAKIISICEEPEFIDTLRKIYITKEKHCNILIQCYKDVIKKEPVYQSKEYEIIGDFKNNLKLIFNNSIKSIDIYREIYFLFNNTDRERDMLFEIILDNQIIICQNVYIMTLMSK